MRRPTLLSSFLILSLPFVSGFEIQSQRWISKHQSSSTLLFSSSSPRTPLSSCPFSTKFPPYQIDLTTPPAPKKRLFALPKSFYKKRDEEWRENEDGLQALTTLWKLACTVVRDEKPLTVAFPDAQPRVLHQFVQIFEWHEQHFPTGVQVEYELVEDVIPTIRIMKIPPPNTTADSASSAPLEEPSHEIVTRRTQAWVQRILVEQRICPFTRSVKASGQGLKDVGVAAAKIDYRTSLATAGASLIADSLESMQNLLQAGPKQISSVLLAAPAFDSQWEYWSGPYFAVLQASVSASQTEQVLGVVCFHPEYQTPDGSTWPGFGQMHSVPRLQQWCNQDDDDRSSQQEEFPKPRTWTEAAAGGAWQRRTPHATLNVLRADQLEAAESRRDSAQLYPENIGRLVDDVGLEQLAVDLERERNL